MRFLLKAHNYSVPNGMQEVGSVVVAEGVRFSKCKNVGFPGGEQQYDLIKSCTQTPNVEEEDGERRGRCLNRGLSKVGGCRSRGRRSR